HTPHPTPHTPHSTPHTPHPNPNPNPKPKPHTPNPQNPNPRPPHRRLGPPHVDARDAPPLEQGRDGVGGQERGRVLRRGVRRVVAVRVARAFLGWRRRAGREEQRWGLSYGPRLLVLLVLLRGLAQPPGALCGAQPHAHQHACRVRWGGRGGAPDVHARGTPYVPGACRCGGG
ncbi:hypothetical protein T484DRAFT_1904867, partial [Baffinella frigidus]